MSITSLEYIFFIGIGIIVYYMLADKYRSRWLLALSLIFMISSSWFGFLVVVFTSYIVYKSALMIEGGKPDEKTLRILISRKRKTATKMNLKANRK